MVKIASILVGDSLFGIEYYYRSGEPNLILVRLWLDNVAIGTFDDETYLPSFYNQLDRLVHPNVKSTGIGKVIESSKSMVALGDTFDDFIVHSFLVGDQLLISARIVSSPFFKHPTWDKKSMVRTTVDLAVAEDVVSKFRFALR